ncbi:immunoglobulin J chain [Gastrophryne carolinensis]
MDKCSILSAALLLLFAVCVTGFFYDEEQERVLVNNKCKCVRVTSKFVPSEEDHDVMVLERNIEITIPLSSRENISDPHSPLRTNFVYDLSKLCQKCDPIEMSIAGEQVLVSSANCREPDNECYTYDRYKCYTTNVFFNYNGKTIEKKVPLNDESCYE